MEQYQYAIGLLGLVLLRPYYKWYWDSSSFRYYNAFFATTLSSYSGSFNKLEEVTDQRIQFISAY